jgi:enoyl-CoA hydratase
VTDEVRYEVRGTSGRVAVFTLNRPEQRNAVNAALAQAMSVGMANFEGDDAVQVGVLTGAGDRAFSAGADLNAVAAGEADALQVEPGGFGGFVRYPRTKPMIAAVNGFALAGGCELALACDIVIASEQSWFGLPEVTRGIVAAAGGIFRLPRVIPRGRAVELMLTGDRIDAQEACRLGLVTRVVPPERVLAEALALADRIAANAPLAIRETLRVLRDSLDADDDRCWAHSTAAAARVQASADAVEGARAFTEKRPARWTGR